MTNTRTYPELEASLADREATATLRKLHPSEKREGAFIWQKNKKYLNLSSNDYLGLATDNRLQKNFMATQKFESLGASGSRLLSGNHTAYTAVEEMLVALFKREAALVFNSGYHANLGILPSLLGPGDGVFSDRMNHASLIDGIRLSGAKLLRYNHCDTPHLETLLQKYRSQFKQAVIVTESIFSMDGDKADLKTLCALKSRYNARLYVDEAHAFGVIGRLGLGECEAQQCIDEVDFIVGTFGKALAALGAFVVTDRVVVDYLINTMRPFIFTTALPPLLVRWVHYLLERIPKMHTVREHLHTLHTRLRLALQSQGLHTLGNSHLLPIMIHKSSQALRAAETLQSQGYLLYAIRPPTVPAGSARLRLSLSAAMTPDDLSALPQTILSALNRDNTQIT
ncbi:8-amino-7-oxononanoate synthase [bacterium]|nr:8-amino-7-oxononanoate synthase [bacterium]